MATPEAHTATEKKLEASILKWVRIKDKAKKDDPAHNQMTAEVVGAEYGVPRKVFVEYLEKEVEEHQACFGLPFTLLLVVSYAIVALTHDNALYPRAVEDSLDIDIADNANFAFTGQFMAHKALDDVSNVADFWSWMSNGLVPLIFVQEKSWHEGYDDKDPWYSNHSDIPMNERGLWLYYNRIVGGVRLRQERSSDDECSQPKSLWPAYGLQCDKGFGYELDPEIRSARFTADPKNEQWLYIDQSLADLQAEVWRLERTKWFDRNVKKVEIAIPAYNGEMGLHVMMRINFFISRGGHIWKKLMPLSFIADMYPEWYYWIGDIVWILCVLYIFVTELSEIYDVLSHRGWTALKKEYVSFWNMFDWFSMICAFTVMAMFGVCFAMLGSLNDSLSKLPSPSNSTEYRKKVGEHFETLEETVQYVTAMRLVIAAYPLIIIARLFKAYSAQPRLAMVTHTLSSAAQELVEFGLVFTSVFITFCISGTILFGREVTAFGTFPRSFFACFRIVIGDLLWEDNMRVGRLWALIFTFLFMLVIVSLLLNMLLAIIMKHYVEAKEKAGNAQTLWSEAFQVFTRWRMQRKGLRISIGKLLHALHKEDQAAAMRKDGDEINTAVDEEEEDLIEELGKCLFKEDLEESYAAFTGDAEELPEAQANELIHEAILYYYDNHNENVDMDEVLKLTHKVEARTKKIQTLARELDDGNPFPNEVEGLASFLREFEEATLEMQRQRDAHRKQTEELRTMKKGYLLQLKCQQQATSATGNDPNDPTSVVSLMAHGKHPRYYWRMNGIDELDENIQADVGHFGGSRSAISRGPNMQERHWEDPLSDDELQHI